MKTLLDVIEEGHYAPRPRMMRTFEAKEAVIEFLSISDDEAEERFMEIDYVVNLCASLDILLHELEESDITEVLKIAINVVREKALNSLKVAIGKTLDEILLGDTYDVGKKLHMAVRTVELTGMLGDMIAGVSKHAEIQRIYRN